MMNFSPPRPRGRAMRASALSIALFVLIARPVEAARIVEFQLEADKLFSLIQHRLVEEEICRLGTFSRPDFSQPVVLDRLAFPGDLYLQWFGQQIQVGVPIEMYTKTPACLRDPSCGPADYTPDEPFVFDVLLDLTAEGTTFCAAVSALRIDGATVALGLVDAGLAEQIDNFVAPICTGLPLRPIQELLGTAPEVTQSGVTANIGAGRLAIRIEFTNPAAPNAPADPSWVAFEDGEMAPQPPSENLTEWSLFVAEELFREANIGRFRASLLEADRFELESGPTATWTALDAGGGRVDVRFSGEVDVEDLPCPTFEVDPVDVSLDYFVDTTIPNAVRALGSMDYDVDDGDVVVCTSLILGPAAGVISAVATSLIVFGTIAGEQGLDSGYLPGECTELSDETFTCDFPVALPSINISKWPDTGRAFGILTLNSMYGLPTGAVLGGPFTVQPVRSKAPLSVGQGGFNYGVVGGCSSLNLGWRGSVRLRGDGRLCIPIEIIDDPLDMFAIDYEGSSLKGTTGLNVAFNFPPLGADTTQYFADPYPLRLVIRSSVGSRAVEFAPPEAPPAEGTPGWHQDNNDLLVARANCHIHLAFIPGRMNPLWLIDPPPWEVAVHVLFDDPATPDSDVTAHLTDLRLSLIDRLEGTFNNKGLILFSGAGMNLQADIAVDFGRRLGSRHSTQVMRFTIDQDLQLDLDAHRLNDGEAEVALSKALNRVLYLAVDDLPAGVQDLAVQLDLHPDDFIMRTPLEAALEPAPQPAPAACGACGAGTLGAFAMILCGLFCQAKGIRRPPTSSVRELREARKIGRIRRRACGMR